MDYEKEYNDLIARINVVKNTPKIGIKGKHHYDGYVETGIRDALDYIINPESEDESEDERIREYLIRLMRGKDQNVPMVQKAIAYLEKQKDEAQRQFNLGVQAGREEAMYEMEKEQKITRWKSLGECSDIPDGHYVVGWFHKGDFRLGIMCKGLFVDPNGNRAEQPKEVFYIPNADEEFIYAEQKPAEWSEDFEENIRILLNDKLTWHSEDGSMSSTVLIDDKTLKDIISGIWFYVGKEAMKYPSKELNVSEWSEEDEKNLKQCIEIVGGWEIDYDNANPHYSTWLKSLRPQPHWKPSKKQMWALEWNINNTPTGVWQRKELESLYKEFKEL